MPIFFLSEPITVDRPQNRKTGGLQTSDPLSSGLITDLRPVPVLAEPFIS